MTCEKKGHAPTPSADIRMRGFPDRASVEQATRWIGAHAGSQPAELIDAECAAGRVLAAPVEAPHAIPSSDRAIIDGYALRAGETTGAGHYNTLSFALGDAGRELAHGAAAAVVSGAMLPPGADAVIAFEAAQQNGAKLEISGEVASGTGVVRRAQQARAGTVMIESGRLVGAQELGFIRWLGLDRVAVVRQPRVGLIIAGPKPHSEERGFDVNGPMLRELIVRDGGIVSWVNHENPASATALSAALADAKAAASADVLLLVGRAGTGSDDDAAPALRMAGVLAIHGIALRPGGSAGMGAVDGVPAFLLPGNPLACFCAYEMLAGRLIRGRGGRDAEPPYRVVALEVGRKIVSAVGIVDVLQVRLSHNRVEPIGSAEHGSLASAVRAAGFVIVPAESEGYPPGARVAVHLYGGVRANSDAVEEAGI